MLDIFGDSEEAVRMQLIADNEKEREIQIGYPTDVKHVAHIGWDSPSSTNSAPSWVSILIDDSCSIILLLFV